MCIRDSIKTASIDTRNKDRDADLRSDKFLDAAKFPEITFASTRVEKTGDGYIAHGTLTIHGVSKDVALPFKIAGTVKDPWGKTRLGAQAGLTINRRDFGVSFSKTLDGGGAPVSYTHLDVYKRQDENHRRTVKIRRPLGKS